MAPLSRSAGYAVLALSSMEGPGGRRVQVKDVAAWIGAPVAYLSKVVQTLTRAGLVNAKRGVKGGVALARPATEITLAHVSEALDGEDCRCTCLLGLTECSDDRGCPVHAFWKEQREAIHAEVSRTTLADLARLERGRRLMTPPAALQA